MLDIVTFKWKPASGYRSKFGPDTVNVLRRMVARHYHKQHRFTCVTDDPAGIDPEVRVIPLWRDYEALPSPHGTGNPSCFRRLRIFSEEMREVIGERILTLDLDVVITQDMTSVWNRPDDDFVIWGDTNPTTPYNGSMILQTAGARKKVWETFHPVNSIKRAAQLNYFGSDQAWISACLGLGEKTWSRVDGVLSFRNHLLSRGRSGALAADARIVIFHGKFDPWDPAVQRSYPWIRDHYR